MSETAAARYADGLAAVTHTADVHFGAEAVLFRIESGSTAWRYDQVRRVDDDNGHIVLRQEPDTGERLILDSATHGGALHAAAPSLFTPHARGRDSWRLLGGLTAAAAVLAGVFLLGVPLASKPLAKYLPTGYADKIGEIAWAQVDAIGQRCTAYEDQQGQAALNSLGQRLASIARPETRDRLSITVMNAAPGSLLSSPNAFALPDGSIVITRSMLDLLQTPEELAGVIAHEVGHIDERHVMANVIRNVGVGVFFDVVFGGAGAGQAVALASVNLASLGYSRGDETEADARGFDFMDAAGLNPGASGALFTRLAAMEGAGGEAPDILQSHPATRARAEAARARAHPARHLALSSSEWAAVRAMCGGGMVPGGPGANAPLPPTVAVPGGQSGGGPAPLPPSQAPIPGGGGKSAPQGAPTPPK
jgi:Zn-dependent protease with chaperone function